METLEFSKESVSVRWNNLTSYFGDPYKMATGLSNMIKPFCGEGDVVARLRKVDLVVKLHNVDNVATVIPLFLEGDALALHLELSDWDQEGVDIIHTRLKQVFAEGPYEAYEKLKSVIWTGESVDVYTNKIKQLMDTEVIVQR